VSKKNKVYVKPNLDTIPKQGKDQGMVGCRCAGGVAHTQC